MQFLGDMLVPWRVDFFEFTLWWTKIAMENPPFDDVFPIEKGEFPLPC